MGTDLSYEGAVSDPQPSADQAHQAVRRVATNALSPFAAQIVTKVLMMGYLIVQYRLLGGQGGNLGDYFVAANLFLYVSTIADWGLSTLLTREAAKRKDDPAHTATLFSQTLRLRLLISLALFLPVSIYIALYVTLFNLSVEGAWAILLITLSLLPGALSGAVSALLYAHERMSLPAAVAVVTSVVNVALGVGALLLGWGIVGLAGAALLASALTALVFWRVFRRDFPGLALISTAAPAGFDRQAAMPLLRAGWPLMLNALLVGLFFRFDVQIIKPIQGEFAVEQYNAAFSFLGFVLLITPAVTLALFPRMARHAERDRARLAYEYSFALKLLLIVSAPIVLLTVWLAPLLITIVTAGKPEYHPASVVALQILIFFLPFSFVNGLTQYVLIALDLQRLITRAFAATVVFNIGANLALVPTLGINGAALATIGSELVLLVPFLMWTRREIGPVPLVAMALRPTIAGAVAGGVGWLLWPLARQWTDGMTQFALYIGAGALLVVVYASVLLLLRPFTSAEIGALRGALRR